MKLFSAIWAFFFDKSHTYFDILAVIALMHYELTWSDGMFWVVFVAWLIISVIAQQINEKLKSFV